MITLSCLFALSCWTTRVQTPEPTTTEQRIERSAVLLGVDPVVAKNIARCESDFKQFNKDGTVKRGKINPHDVGTFQINEDYHLEESRRQKLDIYKEDGNIEYAMMLMKKEGTRPWSWSASCWSKPFSPID